jgi:hypothetical protein
MVDALYSRPFRKKGRKDEQKKITITILQLSELLRGSSIRGVEWAKIQTSQDWKEGLAFKTADNFYVEITGFSGPEISVKDFGDDDILPINILKADTHSHSALSVETKIRALRQLYATLYLIETGRAKLIPAEAELDPSFDLETRLLEERERLGFASIGIGSLFTVLQSLTEGGRKAIITLVALFLPETRQELLRQLRSESDSAELNVQRQEFDLTAHKIKTLLDLQRKTDKLDPAERDRVERLLTRQLHDVGIASPNSSPSTNPRI